MCLHFFTKLAHVKGGGENFQNSVMNSQLKISKRTQLLIWFWGEIHQTIYLSFHGSFPIKNYVRRENWDNSRWWISVPYCNLKSTLEVFTNILSLVLNIRNIFQMNEGVIHKWAPINNVMKRSFIDKYIRRRCATERGGGTENVIYQWSPVHYDLEIFIFFYHNLIFSEVGIGSLIFELELRCQRLHSKFNLRL